MKLKLTLLQTAPVWENVERNLADAEAMLEGVETDLVILPEMFATGFSMNCHDVSEPPGGPAFRWLRRQAAAHDCGIITSVAVRERGEDGVVRYYNRLYFALPDGTVHRYDKRHLFRKGGENGHYEPGNKRLVVGFRGFRIFPVVCYDLRFPVWCRNRGNYDLFVNVASWATARRYAWNTLLKARAIENVCYVAGVNRTGGDPGADYAGDSAVIDFRGQVIAAATDEKVQTVEQEIDMDALLAFRERFAVHLDADRFHIEP